MLRVASFCLLSLFLVAVSPAEEHKLRAAAATSQITPPIGTNIVGGFVPAPSKLIHDDLHARCLVLDDGQTQLAIVVCDLLGIHRCVSLEARELIQKSCGIPPQNVLISGTHTHSAASALGEGRYQSDQPLDDYQKHVAQRIADAVQQAVQQLQPAEIAFTQVDVPEHLFNRRWYMKEGSAALKNPFGKIDKVKMNPPGGSPDLIEPAGPTDPGVSIIAVRQPQGRLLSVLAAYSLHYVGGVGDGHISADYFGVFCEQLKTLQNQSDASPPFVGILANGTSGDVNNINFKTPRPGKPPYEQIQYVAHDLADQVHKALQTANWSGTAPLAARYQELDVKWRTIEPALMDWANMMETAPENVMKPNDLSVIYAGRVRRLSQASPQTKLPVQVLKIGDIAIGASPCETFSETGLAFKKNSSIKHSFMIELAHGYYGYLPTPRHFELGGYETWPGTNYLEPQASEMILDALLRMTAELK